jgi:hypothetical protein
LWHTDPLLINDSKISGYTIPFARQWLNSDHMGIPTNAKATVDTATVGRCFLCGPCLDVISRTVRSNELVVGQSPAGKNVSTEAGDIIIIHHQATSDEDIAD